LWKCRAIRPEHQSRAGSTILIVSLRSISFFAYARHQVQQVVVHRGGPLQAGRRGHLPRAVRQLKPAAMLPGQQPSLMSCAHNAIQVLKGKGRATTAVRIRGSNRLLASYSHSGLCAVHDVASRYAELHPEQVEKLVLFCPGTHKPRPIYISPCSVFFHDFESTSVKETKGG
jgi:hypothetical protein